MKKNYFLTLKGAFLALLFFVVFQSFSQTTTVFTDDFSVSLNNYYMITNGPISGVGGTSPDWVMTSSGTDFATAIGNGQLYLTNDGSDANNVNGWVIAATKNTSSSFIQPSITTLANAPGTVTWSFNMRQSRTNPSGFANGGHAVAFILAGTDGTTNVTGTGYAITLGDAGTAIDPIRLVRYTSGIRTNTTMITSSTAGLADFGTNYTSVRVTYTPSTNKWELFLRNDGSSGAVDPASGTLASQGTSTNSTYTNTALPIMGGYLNGGRKAAFVANFDYVNVNVAVPYISNITPDSKIANTGAFTLTVDGENFVSGSKVRWNGSLRTTTFVSATQLTASITNADIASAGTAQVTVINGTTVSNAETFTIETPGVPTLTPSVSILNLSNTVTGTASSAMTYTISGINLTADPVVTAPANFQISKDGTNFFDTLTLTRSGSNLTPQPTTITVRTKAAAPAGIYSSVISNAVTGGITKQVTVKAKVLAAEPTGPTTALLFTNVTSTSFKLNWTNGNGNNRLVLVKQGSSVNSLPLDGQIYAGNVVFGAGAQLGTGNFVAYSGASNTVTITGLNAATTYYVAIIEYNGTGGTENFLTTSYLTGSQLTRNAPVGWQIYTSNTVNTIDFDNTVDGVNADVFQGAGLAPDGDSGQLDSNAWAITGFSDGTIAFGGTSPEDSDFDSGTSLGGEIEGGLYAFATSANNYSLGIQATTPDFTPGTITLKIQNQTGSTITSLNIGYKVFVYNDEVASNSFNFSYSGDNSTYTSVGALDVVTPGAADATPQWKGYYRATTITGITILSGNYYYVRWSGGATNANHDELGLDDIVLVANPLTVNVPFSNVADNFVVNGNAELSGNLQVNSNLTFSNNSKLKIGTNTLSIKGSLTNTTLLGIKGSATSNLTINGTSNNSLSFDSTTLGTTNLLNNLTIATTAVNTTTLANAVVVNGALTIDVNQTLDLGTIPLTGTITTAVVNGTLATKNTSALPIPSGKTWSGTGTVNYNSVITAQTVVAGTYNSLTVTPTAGAVAGGSLTVNGILNLPTANPTAFVGSLSVVLPNTLTMEGTATNTGIGDVTGDILRTTIFANVLYTFGHKDTSIIFPPIGTLPTEMGLRVEIGTAPAWKPTAVKRIYDFKQTGGTGTKAVIRGHYLDSELNGNIELRLVDYVNRTVAPTGTFEQGRSNFSTTENWIELTNANVAVAFSSNFDIVKLGFAETAITFTTWTGATSNSWNTTTNWSPATVPSQITAVVIPDASTTVNSPTFASGFEVKSISIESGGLLTADTNAVFNIFGGSGAWINNGIFNPGSGTSTVIFKNVDATIAGETTFNNLTIESAGGLRPLTGSIMHIGGTLTNTGTFSAGAFPNTVDFTGTNQNIPLSAGAYQSLTISGTGVIFPTSLDVRGNLKISNTVDFTGKTIAMTGVVGQTISGASANFNNLIINNTSGNVSLSNNASVTGTLTLTSGQLILNNNNLTLGANAVAGTFNSSKMIVTGGSGEVRRTFTALGSYTFPIGENTSPAYSPMTVNVTAGSGFTSAYVGVSVKDGIHPNNYSAQNNLSRYWDVNQSGITGAVANITATYLPQDLTGAESSIVAAQLKGTFNQMSNPWVKFGSIGSNTLTVTGASLPTAMTSAFTGIKGETFSTAITGYGEFCQNDVITLTAETTGGDGPYTYIWSGGLGSASTATPPSSAFGTVNYTLTVRDANGIVATNNADVTILTASVGGTVTNTPQTICKGSKPGTILLMGQTGDVLYWQRSADPTFAVGTINISDITSTLSSEDAGIVNETTYFRAVISNGTCGQVYSAVATAVISSTTWNGSVWSNGAPTTTSSVIIDGDYTAVADMEVCNVTVISGNVVIPSGMTLTIEGALEITGGSLEIADDASFVQIDDNAVNTGTNFTIKRNAEPMYRYDYTYWSSPVVGRSLYELSPNTLADKYFGWDANADNWIPYYGGNKIMTPGAGYSVRAPQTYSVNPAVVATFEGVYTGVPNNGVIEIPVYGNGKYNLLGNPYPSALSADAFLTENAALLEGTIYLWTHNTSVVNNSYSASDYASYNLLGGTGTAAVSEASTSDNVPLGEIASGQGFFIEGVADGTAVFNNAMRSGPGNNQFFRSAATSTAEKHRLWLDISNTNNDFKQILVGYTTNATDGYDKGYDGELLSASTLTLYSFVDEKQLSIQGLPVPFDSSESVPVGFTTAFAGTHTISLDKVDGLFEDQDVFIYDKTLQIVQDLKVAPYSFTTATGTFDGRFEIVYYNTLGNDNFTIQNQFYIYKEQESVVVKSPTIAMKSIQITDMQGRILQTVDDINDFQVASELNVAHQVLLISIKTDDNRIVTKKLMY